MKNNSLAIFGGDVVIDSDLDHYVWPRITKDIENILIRQLHDSISIYNRSGVILEFEEKFAKYHGVKYALLSNSGTSAIFSMFEGISLSPEDEVICPVYTFFATISPVVYSGAKIVFCDSLDDGNICPEDIEKKITGKTKAIIVTHMWGIPCDMDRIVELCSKYGLILLEDCSHAHGACYGDKKVGSFSDASAWSLQGQKIITGGEGGILLTNNKDIYDRALLQGHYNKRCKQEIEKNSDLYEYSVTGFGLKLRSHPLAISIANHQLGFLDEWLIQKRKFANFFIKELSIYPFLDMPIFDDNKLPSWYAFVMQYKSEFSNGVSINVFINALHAEGLKEVDRPGSTSPLDKLPLFSKTEEVMPRLYSSPAYSGRDEFLNAYKFYDNAIKIPVWAFEDEEWLVNRYVEGFHKVCEAIMNDSDDLKKIGN